MERFWLSVFAKGQLNDIGKNVLSKRFWLSVYARGQKNRYLILRFLLSFTAQGQSKLKKQALQQPQLGAGQLLETNTKIVVGTATSQNPAKTQIWVFDGTQVLTITIVIVTEDTRSSMMMSAPKPGSQASP